MQVIAQKTESGRWLRLAVMVAGIAFVEVLSSLVTMPAVRQWYPTLIKPAWNPPNWVFGPIWTMLYAMIAWAGWRLWERLRLLDKPLWANHAIAWFALQMVANLSWSILFFGLHMPLLALVDILLLIIAIIGTMVAAWRVDRFAVWLLVPYLVWVLYAASLNGGIAWLNR